MKKIIYMIAFVGTMTMLQSCGTKESAENTSSKKAEELALETKKAEDRIAKRTSLEKGRAEKAEERRLAYIELYRTTPTYKASTGKVVYYKAEVDPAYNGGEKAMLEYLRDNLRYPQAAQDEGVEGTVFVDFVVDQSGYVTEVTGSDVVGEDVDILLKEEAVRVVAAMPKWLAGTQRGMAVDTRFSVPITFELN
jgi:protein TonB